MSEYSLSRASTFVTAAGLVVDDASGTRVSGHIELTAEHLTPWGVVHGGVYTAAVESAASIGASEAVKSNNEFAVGVNNSTDFLRASKGGRVDVVATPLQQGRIQQLWLVEITATDSGKAIARGTVRLQNIPLPQ